MIFVLLAIEILEFRVTSQKKKSGEIKTKVHNIMKKTKEISLDSSYRALKGMKDFGKFQNI